jgi:tRNA(Ile)-lysidine synthase
VTLDASVAAVRLAVRRELHDVGDGPVLVACSGGADSLALLEATVFEARTSSSYVVGVTVDHGLQPASDRRAHQVVTQMAGLGVDETVAVSVKVESKGSGVEAAARDARYAVLEEVAERFGSGVVLLGHTLDDQAETVLMGLVRGSGGRSLVGMRPRFGPFRRPLLQVRRSQTEAACRARGIEWWDDPHNHDPRFTRSRLRHRVLPVLEEELGPGVSAALARTADLLRDDVLTLDLLAEEALVRHGTDDGLDITGLEAVPVAVVSRVLRSAAIGVGCPPSELSKEHVDAVEELVRGAEGPVRHKQVQLPGHVTAYRDGSTLRFRRTAVSG